MIPAGGVSPPPSVAGSSAPAPSVFGTIISLVTGSGISYKPFLLVTSDGELFNWDNCGAIFKWSSDNLVNWNFDDISCFEILHNILQIEWKILRGKLEDKTYQYEFESDFVTLLGLSLDRQVSITEANFPENRDITKLINEASELVTFLIKMFSSVLNLYFASEYDWHQTQMSSTNLTKDEKKNIGTQVAHVLHSNHKKIMDIITITRNLNPVVLFLMHLLQEKISVIVVLQDILADFFEKYADAAKDNFFELYKQTFTTFKNNVFNTNVLFNLVATRTKFDEEYKNVKDIFTNFERILDNSNLLSEYKSEYEKYALEVNYFSEIIAKNSPIEVDKSFLLPSIFGSGTFTEFPILIESKAINNFLVKSIERIKSAYDRLVQKREGLNKLCLDANKAVFLTDFYKMYATHVILEMSSNSFSQLSQLFEDFLITIEHFLTEKAKHVFTSDFELLYFNVFNVKSCSNEIERQISAVTYTEGILATYKQIQTELASFPLSNSTQKKQKIRTFQAQVSNAMFDDTWRSSLQIFISDNTKIDQALNETGNIIEKTQDLLVMYKEQSTLQALLSFFILTFCNDAYGLGKNEVNLFLVNIKRMFFILKYYFNHDLQSLFEFLACCIFDDHNRKSGSDGPTIDDLYSIRAVKISKTFKDEKKDVLTKFVKFTAQPPTQDSHERVKHRLDLVSMFLDSTSEDFAQLKKQLYLDGSHEFNDLDTDESEMSHMMVLRVLLAKIEELNSTTKQEIEKHRKAGEEAKQKAEDYLAESIKLATEEREKFNAKTQSFVKEVQVWQEEIQAQCKGDFLIAQKMREIYGTKQMKMMMAPHETTMRLPAAPKIVL